MKTVDNSVDDEEIQSIKELNIEVDKMLDCDISDQKLESYTALMSNHVTNQDVNLGGSNEKSSPSMTKK